MTLDSILAVVTVLAITAGVLATIAGFLGEPGGWIAAGGLFGLAITCALGQVLVYIAQRADYVTKLLELERRDRESRG